MTPESREHQQQLQRAKAAAWHEATRWYLRQALIAFVTVAASSALLFLLGRTTSVIIGGAGLVLSTFAAGWLAASLFPNDQEIRESDTIGGLSRSPALLREGAKARIAVCALLIGFALQFVGLAWPVPSDPSTMPSPSPTPTTPGSLMGNSMAVLPQFVPDFGNVPQWLSAVGTVGALTLALVQINRERQHREASEDKDRKERRLEQARLVSAVAGHQQMDEGQGRTAIHLINGSDEPVYSLVVGIVFIQGAAPRTLEAWMDPQVWGNEPVQPSALTTVSILPSGHWQVSIQTAAFGVMAGRIGAEVAFTDRAGIHWVRRATGKLEELPTEPVEYVGLHGPYELQIPERVADVDRG